MMMARCRIQNASSLFYFTKESLIQRLMHQFKYQGNQDLGRQLGLIMGAQLKESGRFNGVDVLLPLPLFEDKERKRGFNQSRVLCQGIQEVMGLPIIDDAVVRPFFTETQTKKNRIERWRNMEGKFQLADRSKISNVHVLLVDDVITTGATIEACAEEILKAPGVQLSLATLCFATDL